MSQDPMQRMARLNQGPDHTQRGDHQLLRYGLLAGALIALLLGALFVDRALSDHSFERALRERGVTSTAELSDFERHRAHRASLPDTCSMAMRFPVRGEGGRIWHNNVRRVICCDTEMPGYEQRRTARLVYLPEAPDRYMMID